MSPFQIAAARLLEYANSIYEADTLNNGRWPDDNAGRIAKAEYDELLELAAFLRPMGWIPVSERLPEAFEVVLVYNEACGIKDLYVDSDYEWFNVPYSWIEKGGVTHWMPLPEPPEDA